MVTNTAKWSFTTTKEALNKNTMDTTKNTTNFLNTMSEEDLRTMGIKDIITVITWVRKVVGKHQHIETVQAEIDIMQHQIKIFKGLFVSLFQKGFPSFWREDGKLLSQSGYQELFVICRLDHIKFEDMNQYLLGKIVIDKLAVDFEIIDTFRIVCTRLPPISYADHV